MDERRIGRFEWPCRGSRRVAARTFGIRLLRGSRRVAFDQCVCRRAYRPNLGRRSSFFGSDDERPAHICDGERPAHTNALVVFVRLPSTSHLPILLRSLRPLAIPAAVVLVPRATTSGGLLLTACWLPVRLSAVLALGASNRVAHGSSLAVRSSRSSFLGPRNSPPRRRAPGGVSERLSYPTAGTEHGVFAPESLMRIETYSLV